MKNKIKVCIVIIIFTFIIGALIYFVNNSVIEGEKIIEKRCIDIRWPYIK